jgi:hypothetical protein
MVRRFTTSIVRALRATSAADPVHFHADADGRPFVCDFHNCASPGLDPRRA